MMSTERYLEIANAIVSTGKCSTLSELATILGKAPRHFTDVKNGKSSPNFHVVQVLKNTFHVNPDYIATGSGNIFSDTITLEEKVKNLEDEVMRLKVENMSLKRENSFLHSILEKH